MVKAAKFYDPPITPYWRLLADLRIDGQSKKRLESEHRKIDIIGLTQSLDGALALLASQATLYRSRASGSDDPSLLLVRKSG